MITIGAEIECFGPMGEKTGWRYVFIPAELAARLKPDCRTGFRVRGFIDSLPVEGMALMPMGGGDFILTLRSSLRKKLRKEVKDKVTLQLEEDIHFKIEMPDDLEVCLLEDKGLISHFLSQTKSHQNYFINYINEAKTEATRTKRIIMTVNAMENKMDFGAMIRAARK